MKDIGYILNSCNTCQRIVKEVNWQGELVNIKEQNIDAKTLDFIAKQAGGYEQVFSRRAMKYRSQGLNEMTLTEKDYRKYILEEYTFLKRPVFIVDDVAYVGNTKAVVASLKAKLES